MENLSFEIKKILKKTKDIYVYKVLIDDKIRIIKLVKVDGDIPNSNYQCELNHPNVIRCFEKGITKISDEKFYYSILEYADNKCLINSSKEFETEPFNFIKDILTGLKYLHDNNIIHGDLKPSNILIAKQFDKLVCKISDYDSITGEKNKFFITPEIIAPEWTNELNVQTDIWAFGILLYKQIIGYYPFGSRSNGESYNEIINGILNQPLDKLDIFKIEEPFRWIIYRCLQKNPKDRFVNIDEILVELNYKQKFSKSIYQNISYLKGAFIGNLR